MNPFWIFVILPLLALAVVSLPAVGAFACYCDRIGREAAAPLSRAFGLSLLIIAVILIIFAPKA